MRKKPPWTKIHIWADSQTAFKRLQHTDPGPRQWLARHIIRRARQLSECRTAMEIHWVLKHTGVEGNERVDKVAKEAAEGAGTCRCPEQFVSLAHV